MIRGLGVSEKISFASIPHSLTFLSGGSQQHLVKLSILSPLTESKTSLRLDGISSMYKKVFIDLVFFEQTQ